MKLHPLRKRAASLASPNTFWKRTSLLVVLLSALFIGALSEFDLRANNRFGAAGMLAALRNPLDVIGDRSPGNRQPGVLHSVKAGLAPRERVLSEMRERGPASVVQPSMPVFNVGPEQFLPGDPFPEENAPAFDGNNGSPFSSGLPATPDSGAFSQPPDAFLPNAQDPQFLPANEIQAVPEPTTWAMLMVGFFSIGVALRRNADKRSVKPLVSASR